MTIQTIDQMVDALISREGGYSNNPNDAGGETMWGITARTARDCGYQGQMCDMPRATAASIYRTKYFTKTGYDLIYAVSPKVAEELLDTAVNMGESLPGAWLQRILNALNRRGKDYSDIGVDGRIGPATVGALRSLLSVRGLPGETAVLRALNAQQAVRYLDITEARPQNEDFYFGWLTNRVTM